MALARWQATIVDAAGNVVPGAQVTVRAETGGLPLAPVFSDRAGVVPLGNPFSADANGFAAFHAAGGAYYVRASAGAFERIWRFVAIGTGGEIDTAGIREIAIPDGDKGDIVTSGAGNVWDVQDDAVTLAKMAHGTRGELLYYGEGNAPLRLAPSTAGRALVTNGAGADPSWNDLGAWLIKVKAADTSRVNNTLLADPELVFPMLANAGYAFRASVFYDSAATPDFKWRHAGPASPTLVRITRRNLRGGLAAFSDIFTDTAYSGADNIDDGGATGAFLAFEGIVLNGVNAGNFEFRWAQNVTNAAATIVRAGSYLEHRQVS